MKKEKKDELELDEEEKETLLEYMRMQNEALKRIFKNAVEKEKNEG
ncbi:MULTISPECIES: hypothetical protein [Neobacillus]|uniref:Uncharacterized protein n=1 Tax=Neobacillus rhizophilus TaxID=2833579 RepID=A0A942TZ64_9BACI|nr:MULTISPECIES: hypothetical protein [Neobacillus]MBS4211495.1 hypothetical protein [Neobacillus rhizophilus]MBU8916913.1 hypothetical protein [Bacillus sp. FJAT-29953]